MIHRIRNFFNKGNDKLESIIIFELNMSMIVIVDVSKFIFYEI